MQDHIRVVAWLHIISGALGVAMAAFVGMLLMGVGAFAGGEEFFLLSGIGLFVAGVVAVVAAPSLIGGWGLLRRRPWARVLVIVLSFLNLFAVPVGTMIGGYSLWVLMNDETRRELAGGHGQYPSFPR